MKKSFWFFVLISILSPASALATPFTVSVNNPLSSGTLNDAISKVASGVGDIVAGAGIVALLVAAIFFATAAGNEEQYKKAKKALIYAVIGIAVGVGANILVLVIRNIAGV